ncbi:MAG: RDD family protein [Erysipelotrichaceae bacterium]
MSETTLKNYSTSELIKIYAKQKSRRYEKEGRFHIRTITNKDLGRRLMSFLTDSIVMFLPIYFWYVFMLLIFSDLLPVSFTFYIQVIVLVLLMGSMLFLQPYIVQTLSGQSIGKNFNGLKVVNKDGHEASPKVLFLREMLSKGAPVLIFGLFFGVLGIVGYALFCGLWVLVDRRHRSWVDLLFKTRVVVLLKADSTVQVKEKVPVKPVVIGKSANKIDLHMHSTFSGDGELNVEEIFSLAAKRGVKLISIADHNSAKANLIAQRMSKLYHVGYISGIEIDAQYKGKNLHLLGYNIDYKSDLFNKIENDNLTKEKDASIKRVALWEEFSGMKIDREALLVNNRFQTIPAEMIAEQIMNNPEYRKDPILEPYITGDRNDMPYVNFYWDYFSQGKPCYVDVRNPDVGVVTKLIKATGGIAILAHPYVNFADDISVVREILALGVDGLEVFSSYHNKKQMSELLKIASEEKCLITAGSDFHGKNKPSIQIGDTKCPPDGEKILNRFLNKIK